MSSRVIDNRKKFKSNFEHNWPSALQYMRSTKHPRDVLPELKEPTRKILYGFAMQSGQLPTVESLSMVYNFLLNKKKEGDVENFFRSKAKRQQRKKARQDKRAKRKAAGERTGLGRFVHNIGKGVVNLQLLPLAPFKGVMRKALLKEGVSTSKKEPIRQIVSKFLRFVVKNQAPQLYPDKAVMDLDSLPDDGTENFAIGPVIATVIQAVKGFIETIVEKKKEGKKLKPIEEEILIGADRAAKEVDNYRREEEEQAIGGFLKKNWVPILAGLFLLVFLARR